MRILRAAPAALVLVAASFLHPQDLFASACAWDSGTGDWTDVAHWTSCGGGFPDAGDTATISGGTVTLSSNQAVGGLTLSGGAITGTGNLALSGTSSWTAGTMAGTGTTTIAAGGTLTINASGVSLQRILTNNGTLTWTAGQIQMVNGTINNNATFTAQPDNNIANFGGTNAFNNNGSGTFTRNTGTGTLTIGIPFTNAGTLNINTGTLSFQSTGSSTGTITCLAGITLTFSNDFTITLGTLTVPGTLAITNGTVTVGGAGTYTVANVALSGGTFALNVASANSVWQQSGGVLSGSGNITVASGKTYSWTAGTMAGTGTTTIAAGGTLTINASGVSLQRILTNNGTLTWTAGQIQMVNGTINNNATFTAQPDNNIANFGGTNAFNNNGSGTFTRNTGTGTLTIGIPFTNAGTLNINTGTLSFQSTGSSTGTITCLAGITLTFSNDFTITLGTLTVPGTLAITNGTVTVGGAGTYTVANVALSGGTFVLNVASANSVWQQSGGVLSGSGNITVASGKTYSWTAGTMAGTGTTTIAAGGTLTINASGVSLQRILTNNGTLTWTAGQIQMVNGTINNNATFTAQPDNNIANFGGTNAFNNNGSGTFTRNTGTGTLTIGIPFTNAGTLNINTGTLSFQSTGSSTGTITCLAGITLTFSNDFTITLGTLTVPGTLAITNGTVTVGGAGTYTVANVALSGGTFALNVASANSVWQQSGGVLSGSGNITVASGKTYSWTAGTMAGTGTTTIAAGGTLTINASGVSLQRILTNNGTLTWTAGQIQMVNGTINNNATFTAQPDNNIANFGGTNAFNNNGSGTFTRNTGTGTLTIGIPFTNAGTLNINTGTLSFQSTGSSTGTITCLASITLTFSNDFTITLGTLTVPGTLAITNGTVTVGGAGTYTVANVALSGGTFALNVASANSVWQQSGGVLSGSGNITVASGKTYSWTAGTMAGTGTTTIAAGGTLTINASGVSLQRILTNNGTLTWTAGQIQMVNGTINNNVVLPVQGDTNLANFGGTNAFNNTASGTFTRNTSSGTLTIGVPFHNAGTINASSGTLDISGGLTQTAGQTILNGGALAGSTLDFQGGVLKGVGTITANVSNSATVSPGSSPGVISIVGNYTQTAAGTLAVELNGTSPGTGYDQLAVTGTVTLAGTLSLTFGFVPVTATPFTIITNADTDAVTGNFAGLTEGTVLVTPTVNLRVTYQGGTGNEVVLTPLFQALYHTVQPCRVADTRTTAPPPLAAGQSRSFSVAGTCGIPPTAQAVAFNFTIVAPTALGDLRIFPGGAALPTVSTINYRSGQVRANNAIILLGPAGDIAVRVDQGSGSVQLVIDVNGYFE